MPIENDGQNVDREPERQTLIDPPLQSARSEYRSAAPATQTTAQNESLAIKLEQDVRGGERWLIGIGIATLLINSAIAVIYLGQLQQMKKATEAATQASQTAKDALNEMRTGSGATDTHTLALQAVTQATQTKNLATAAGKQNSELRESVAQAGRLAKAAEEANAYGVKAKRPWVGMTGSLVLTKFVDGPHPTIEFTTDIKNFGGSPAFSVIPIVNLVQGDLATEIKPKIEEACKFLDQNLLQLRVGEMVFPGDDYSFPTEATPDASPKLKVLNPDRPIYFFPGCVAYLDGEGKVHHTSICQWTDAKTFRMGSKFSSCSRQFAH